MIILQKRIKINKKFFFLKGFGVEINEESALSYFKKAIEVGLLQATSQSTSEELHNNKLK